MPVSSIWVRGSNASNFGADRWIGHRSVISRSVMSSLRHSPVTFHTRPLVTSPTGTEIGAPVSIAFAPRRMPSVGFSEIARTMLSPTCSATSAAMVRVWSPELISINSLLLMSGIWSAANSMSTTGPITRATRPVAAVSPASVGVCVVTVIFCLA